MALNVATLNHGGPIYAGFLDLVRADATLVNTMWADGEHRVDELDVPGTSWTVALVDGQPAAWCAARVEAGVLRCFHNYESRAHRGRGLYAAAYAARHRNVIVPSGLPAVTYLFAQPIDLHEADGWAKTGVEGDGELPGHYWWELRRPA